MGRRETVPIRVPEMLVGNCARTRDQEGHRLFNISKAKDMRIPFSSTTGSSGGNFSLKVRSSSFQPQTCLSGQNSRSQGTWLIYLPLRSHASADEHLLLSVSRANRETFPTVFRLFTFRLFKGK